MGGRLGGWFVWTLQQTSSGSWRLVWEVVMVRLLEWIPSPLVRSRCVDHQSVSGCSTGPSTLRICRPMSVKPVRTLDYAAPPARRRFDPARWPPIPLLIGMLFFTAFLATSGIKVVPGGPFISLHADVAPAVLSVAFVAVAWRSLRHGPLLRRLTVALLTLCAVMVLILVLDSVISFWLRPHARGVLVGW